MMFRPTPTLVLTLLSAMLISSSVSAEPVAEKIKAAMKSDIRSEAETKRDANRRPVETLGFYGLEDDMRVIELIPGGGWYTKLLAPALADNGQLYLAIGTGRVSDNILNLPGFENVTVLDTGVSPSREEGSPFYTLPGFNLDVEPVDRVFTFRNYHNFNEAGRRAMNQAAFAALKPGGVYAIVDHTRRHMEADSGENRRRVDPVLVIKEVQEAGFVFEDYSDLHFRADDELRYEVGRKSVTGNTDRFTFKFRKPE